MFANAAIKGCLEWISKDPSTRDWIRPVVEGLTRSQKIYVGDSADLFNATGAAARQGKTLFTDAVPSVRPPFADMMIMYTAKDTRLSKPRQKVIGLNDVNGDGKVLDLYQLENVETVGWMSYPVLATITNTPGVKVFNARLQEDPVSVWWQEELMAALTYEERQEVFTTTGYAINVAYATMLLMSCKNVTTQDIVAPEKQQKARAKKGQLPIYTYKVLSVTCPSNAKRTKEGKDTANPGTQRLHVCRGHFKEYTADAPLLGKAVGRYWWQPMVRGHVKNGVVDKDYNIKTK